MDTLKKYQDAVVKVLSDFVAVPHSLRRGLERQLVADREHNRFLVITFGWPDEDEMAYSTLLHLEIKDGKIWVQQNWTELEIATELIEQGVPKSDIVLGFVPAYARQYTEFAAA